MVVHRIHRSAPAVTTGSQLRIHRRVCIGFSVRSPLAKKPQPASDRDARGWQADEHMRLREPGVVDIAINTLTTAMNRLYDWRVGSAPEACR
jgi:hypothetical protein